jgi:hypothetical protein
VNLAEKFEISDETGQLFQKLKTFFDDFHSSMSEEQKRLFENFDLNKIVNSVLNQLNKVSNIDSLLVSLKTFNINGVLEHPNVKKLVKQLLLKADLVKKFESLMSSYEVSPTIRETLSADWLKGWTIMNLLTDANIYRMVENLSRTYEIESIVDRVSGFLTMANLFASLNLDSFLETLNADDIMRQISQVDFEDIKSNLKEKATRKKPASDRNKSKSKDNSSKKIKYSTQKALKRILIRT